MIHNRKQSCSVKRLLETNDSGGRKRFWEKNCWHFLPVVQIFQIAIETIRPFFRATSRTEISLSIRWAPIFNLSNSFRVCSGSLPNEDAKQSLAFHLIYISIRCNIWTKEPESFPHFEEQKQAKKKANLLSSELLRCFLPSSSTRLKQLSRTLHRFFN